MNKFLLVDMRLFVHGYNVSIQSEEDVLNLIDNLKDDKYKTIYFIFTRNAHVYRQQQYDAHYFIEDLDNDNQIKKMIYPHLEPNMKIIEFDGFEMRDIFFSFTNYMFNYGKSKAIPIHVEWLSSDKSFALGLYQFKNNFVFHRISNRKGHLVLDKIENVDKYFENHFHIDFNSPSISLYKKTLSDDFYTSYFSEYETLCGINDEMKLLNRWGSVKSSKFLNSHISIEHYLMITEDKDLWSKLLKISKINQIKQDIDETCIMNTIKKNQSFSP